MISRCHALLIVEAHFHRLYFRERKKEREREANKNHIMTDRQKRTEEAMGEAMYQMAMSYPDSRHLQIHDGKDGQP